MFAPRSLHAFPHTALIACLALSAAACASGTGQVASGTVNSAGSADSASFVTRLGVDTVAIERVVYTPRRVDAEVLLRVPNTTRTRYVLDLTPAGELARLEAVTTDPRQSGAERRELLRRIGDSLRVETTGQGQSRTRTVAARDLRVLPFIDVVHWPFELAFTRARAQGVRQTGQPLLTGSRVQEFPIADLGPDSMTLTHPARGTMRVRVDERGRLLALDAGATTRKLLVERRAWMGTDAIDAIATRWAAMDAAGRSLGALSGRGRSVATLGSARIEVDFGTPSKRGREIWGGLVPFGQVWRTGANQATHFTTDRDLVFGTAPDTLLVPAGRYTLFSIPEREGGVLIVSKQAGQAGTAYDPAHDLGRVRLRARPLDRAVETFGISILAVTVPSDPRPDGGELRLEWDRTQLVVPFRVRAP